MSGNGQSDRMSLLRHDMVEGQLRARNIRDERLLDVMARVPRHEFVDEKFQDEAYGDHPIPLPEGQTVSQPYMVALMLEALALEPQNLLLEIGTGSGYQTALLAQLATHVYTVERHPHLAETARATLERLGYHNVTVIIGDGSEGLEALGPFDRIIVSAAAPQIPQALLDQLAEGGRLVVPVGGPGGQELQLLRKQGGAPILTRLDLCRFVPLVGAQGFPSDW
jgi:protein-L-isoaspartate(D-aspartate) O-methyltransferase